ncbi:hypothetical protein QE152_g32061 [Popillia japonica]|uniref:Uncharacterized protein n=1 Tax=Popillia japonica TaxID=7064 RepID=A0AAW1J0A9_POPJA
MTRVFWIGLVDHFDEHCNPTYDLVTDCMYQTNASQYGSLMLARSNCNILDLRFVLTMTSKRTVALCFSVLATVTCSVSSNFSSVPTTVKTYENTTVLLPCYLEATDNE